MATIGVRDLKTHLSRYLKTVRTGRTLTVTDRGRAIAVICPVESSQPPAWATRLTQDGSARWSGGKPKGLAKRLSSTGRRLASQMVLDDRR